MARISAGIPMDPRLQEKYMQDSEFEKMKTELSQAEAVFKKMKDDVYGFPKVVHPFAAHCKQMIKSCESLYPKECPFFEVGKEFSDAFEALASAYNEFVYGFVISLVECFGKGCYAKR
jgi:hypothetical protein